MGNVLRPSLFGPQPELDTAIVVPNGYFLSLENLWWVRSLDKEKTNDASKAYGSLMRRALAETHHCLERGEDFDITVDDGHPIASYRRIVQLKRVEPLDAGPQK